MIEYISNSDKTSWEIQPSEYVCKSDFIMHMYNDISEKVIEDNNRGIVLITKIMLGVFGIVPAFDEYFCKCFKNINPSKSRFASFNKDSLEVINQFYIENQKEIDSLSNQIATKDFNDPTISPFNYPRAKIIDMYGFVVGTSEQY